jgi:hypothetical protein
MPLWSLAVALLVLAAGAREGADSDAAVARAREALRARLGVADTRIHLVDAAPASWNDTSLGCPEKGQAYQPVVTQGHVVHLRVDDRTYDVRVGGERALVCEAAESAAAQAVAAARVSRLARRELAARLELPESGVHVELVRPRTWPDASLGCGTADVPAPQAGAGVKGFLIELTAGGRSYEYHADGGRVISCDPATTGAPAK